MRPCHQAYEKKQVCVVLPADTDLVVTADSFRQQYLESPPDCVPLCVLFAVDAASLDLFDPNMLLKKFMPQPGCLPGVPGCLPGVLSRAVVGSTFA